jgi:hypothetical protein
MFPDDLPSIGEYGFDWWFNANFRLATVSLEETANNLIISVMGEMVLDLDSQPELREMAERVASLVPQDEVVG